MTAPKKKVITITKAQRAKIKATEKRVNKIVGSNYGKKIMARAVKMVKAGKKDIKDLL